MTARLYDLSIERAKRRPAFNPWDFYFQIWMFWLNIGENK